MKEINKLIVKHSIIFYSYAWCYRNDILYNSKKYNVFVINWYKKIVKMIKRSNKMCMMNYLRMYRLDPTKCNSSYIRK